MWGHWITRELLANCQSKKGKVASLALPAANIHRKFPHNSICQLKAYMHVSGSLHAFSLSVFTKTELSLEEEKKV